MDQAIEEGLAEVAKCRLRVEEIPGKGRCLVAAERIRPGQEVIREDPLAAVLSADQINVRCDETFEKSETLLRCSRSKVAKYSSKEAQLLAWKRGFKRECQALVNLGLVPTPTIRLLARIYWRRSIEGPSWKWCIFENLVDHWTEMTDKKKVDLAEVAVLVRKFVMEGNAKADDAPDVRDICHNLARLSCNGHTICDVFSSIGVGVFGIGSLFNHSCDRNCYHSFVGKKLVVIAMREIAPGEELSISYTNLFSLAFERREYLLKEYYFDTSGQSFGSHRKDWPEPQLKCQLDGSLDSIHLYSDVPDFIHADDVGLTSLCRSRSNGGEVESIGGAAVSMDYLSSGAIADVAAPTPREGRKVVVWFHSHAYVPGDDNCSIIGKWLLEIASAIVSCEDMITARCSCYEVLPRINQALALCDNGCGGNFQLGAQHIFRYRLLDQQHQAVYMTCQSDQNFEPLVDCAQRMATFIQQTWGDSHPTYGYYKAVESKAQAYLGHLEPAAANARAAVTALSLSLPGDSHLLIQTVEAMNMVQMELASIQCARKDN